MPSALAELKILDFSRVLAGPLATMVLADLGLAIVWLRRASALAKADAVGKRSHSSPRGRATRGALVG